MLLGSKVVEMEGPNKNALDTHSFYVMYYLVNLIFIYSKSLSLESVIFERECPGLSKTVVVFSFVVMLLL